VTTAVVAAAWLLGIAAAAWGLPAAPGSAGAALGVFLWRRRTDLPTAALACACAGVALLAAARWQAVTRPPGPDDVAHLVDAGPVRLRGVVRGDAEERERSQRLRVAVRELLTTPGPRPLTGTLLVRTALGRRYQDGDVVELTGHVSAPPALSGFDYRAYLARQGIYAQMDYPRLRVVGRERAPWPQRWLRTARRAAAEALDRALPHPEAALARGLVLGDRAGIPREVYEAFARSGTAHLIAISGFNISLTAGLAIGALSWLLGRRGAALVALVTITGYAAFVGLSPSVARALVMGALVIVSSLTGRPGAPPVSLAVAAALMTAHHPPVLRDPGFQLSFAATAGILLLAPPWQALGERVLARAPAAGALLPVWRAAAVTLAAEAATLPVTVSTFGRMSLVGLPANLLAAPLFPPALLGSALTAVAGVLIPPLGVGVGVMTWLPLHLLIGTARLAGGLPWATIAAGRASLLLVALGLVPVLLTLRWRDRLVGAGSSVAPRPRLRPVAVVVLGMAAITLGVLVARAMERGGGDGWLHVAFVEAGGTPVALVTGPQGERVLVDTGPSGAPLARAVDPLLPAHGRRVAVVVLSRGGVTATGGLAEAVRRYRPEAVLAPAGVGPSDAHGVPLVRVDRSMVLALSGGARLELEPVAGGEGQLAVVVVRGGRRIAVTPHAAGDVGPARGSGPGTTTIALTAAPALRYEPRRQGPIEVRTDGHALVVRPRRGGAVPEGLR
jgi:competence protein ComEC